MLSKKGFMLSISLVPRPSVHEKRVWCSEQHFLTWGGADLGFEITNWIAEDVIILT